MKSCSLVSSSRLKLFASVAALCAIFSAGVARAEKLDAQQYQKCVQGGVNFLLFKALQPDGSYSATPQSSPAVTAICVAGILRSGRSPDDPAVAKSLKYLESFVQS